MEGRIQYSASDLKIEKLSKSEDLSFFSCGCKDLDLFFQKEIHLCIKYKYVSAYCVKDILDNSIVALFTLSHDSVLLSCDSEKNEFIEEVSDIINGEYQYIFKKQSSFPAINIGHLAVLKEKQGKNIGKNIIDFIISTFIDYNISGCQFITVDSLNNPRTNKFYLKYGFINQTNTDINKTTRRMYFPLKIYD